MYAHIYTYIRLLFLVHVCVCVALHRFGPSHDEFVIYRLYYSCTLAALACFLVDAQINELVLFGY